MTKRSTLPTVVRALYLSSPQPHQDTMLEMRERILTILPDAEEIVSYGMPAFRVNGIIACGMKAAKNHVGYYPFSGSILPLFEKELATFSRTKSALHIPVDQPLNLTLLKTLISARLTQSATRQ